MLFPRDYDYYSYDIYNGTVINDLDTYFEACSHEIEYDSEFEICQECFLFFAEINLTTTASNLANFTSKNSLPIDTANLTLNDNEYPNSVVNSTELDQNFTHKKFVYFCLYHLEYIFSRVEIPYHKMSARSGSSQKLSTQNGEEQDSELYLNEEELDSATTNNSDAVDGLSFDEKLDSSLDSTSNLQNFTSSLPKQNIILDISDYTSTTLMTQIDDIDLAEVNQIRIEVLNKITADTKKVLNFSNYTNYENHYDSAEEKEEELEARRNELQAVKNAETITDLENIHGQEWSLTDKILAILISFLVAILLVIVAIAVKILIKYFKNKRKLSRTNISVQGQIQQESLLSDHPPKSEKLISDFKQSSYKSKNKYQKFFTDKIGTSFFSTTSNQQTKSLDTDHKNVNSSIIFGADKQIINKEDKPLTMTTQSTKLLNSENQHQVDKQQQSHHQQQQKQHSSPHNLNLSPNHKTIDHDSMRSIASVNPSLLNKFRLINWTGIYNHSYLINLRRKWAGQKNLACAEHELNHPHKTPIDQGIKIMRHQQSQNLEIKLPEDVENQVDPDQSQHHSEDKNFNEGKFPKLEISPSCQDMLWLTEDNYQSLRKSLKNFRFEPISEILTDFVQSHCTIFLHWINTPTKFT